MSKSKQTNHLWQKWRDVELHFEVKSNKVGLFYEANPVLAEVTIKPSPVRPIIE